jgi:hypothetical protein
MQTTPWFRDPGKLSKIATIIIFLALIRSISEPLRLQYYADATLTYHEIKPFLIGALVASTGLLAMIIFSYYGRHKIMIAMFILTILLMIMVKIVYHIP